MVKKKKNQKEQSYSFYLRGRNIKVLLDNVLLFKLIRRLHGRFWGIAAIIGMSTGFAICFLINSSSLTWSTAFSDFGKDVRTAPYFAGSVFFAAYGLWRWRNYLSRTLKRTQPILFLISLTIVGLYLVALMPVSWQPWPYRIHIFGVLLAGLSMALTVIFDILLSKTRRNQNMYRTRVVKLISFGLIIIGGSITLGSSDVVGYFRLALVGEILMLAGYGIWIILKTYQGEDPRSSLSRQLKKVVLLS